MSSQWLIALPQPAPSVWTEELAFNLDFTFHWMPSPKAFIIQQFIEAEGCDSLQKLRFHTWWVSSYSLITYWITLWFLAAQGRLPRMYSKTLPFISKYNKCDLMFLEWAVDAVHISLTPAVAYLASPETSLSSLRAPFPRSSRLPSLLSWCNELMCLYFNLQAIPSRQLSTMPFRCCGTSSEIKCMLWGCKTQAAPSLVNWALVSLWAQLPCMPVFASENFLSSLLQESGPEQIAVFRLLSSKLWQTTLFLGWGAQTEESPWDCKCVWGDAA